MGERRELPILFSGEMVGAILDGRKTVTRRVVKWPILSYSDGAKQRIFGPDDVAEINRALSEPGRHPNRRIKGPYGSSGGLLWVRESWYDRKDRPDSMHDPSLVHYAADGEPGESCQYRKRPSIHMPKWAARIWLRVTGVRVERVQEITEVDAKAEGIVCGDGEWHTDDGWRRYKRDRYGWYVGHQRHNAPSHAFRSLWDRINAKRGYPWADNPWVWVVRFEVAKAGRTG